jgi:bifunctional DNA-binding transcriptional regulator/antitoxin component of YhaV-PrlF toxin-antitoxin module
MAQRAKVVELEVGALGEVTLPEDLRERLGVVKGGRVRVVSDEAGVHVSPAAGSKFEEYRGWGNPGLPEGGEAVLRYFRELRGHDDVD